MNLLQPVFVFRLDRVSVFHDFTLPGEEDNFGNQICQRSNHRLNLRKRVRI